MSLEKAMEFADMVTTFPQMGLDADRDSAYYPTYQASSFEDGLAYEFNMGIKAVTEARANCVLERQSCEQDVQLLKFGTMKRHSNKTFERVYR